MENHKNSFPGLKSRYTTHYTVVIQEDIDPTQSLVDIQRALAGVGAWGCKLYFDTGSSKTSLDVTFTDKERANQYLARFDSQGTLVHESDGKHMSLNDTLKNSPEDGQWSASATSSTIDRFHTPESTIHETDGLLAPGAAPEEGLIGLEADDVPYPGKTYKIRHHKSAGDTRWLFEGV